MKKHTLTQMQDSIEKPLINLQAGIKNPLANTAYRMFSPPLELALGVTQLNAIHKQINQDELRDFFSSCLHFFDVQYDLSESDLEKIPQEGPCILVANHPMGGIEGIILGHILNRRRSDFRLLVNYLLNHIPKIRPYIFEVDPFEEENSAKKNLAPLKQVIRWLKGGNCLGTFPSGEVSSFSFREGGVTDPTWNPVTAKLAMMSKATVVPVYFSGKNSMLFQAAGKIHPRLRTAFLVRELVNKAGATLKVRIGNPITHKTYSNLESAEQITDFFRFRSYMLSKRTQAYQSKKKKRFSLKKADNQMEPIVDPVESHLMIQDLESLPASRTLFSKGNSRVIYAKGIEIPNLLREIGRLREYTFRKGNEGTGKSIDLDPFDEYYYHIILLDVEMMEIIGAYRAGKSHEIIGEKGSNGLYTRTLFKYKQELIDLWGPSIELGRSFIAPEHQRKFTSLSILWQGIGAFVCREPRYKMLFGPVSIDETYNRVSRDLMVFFLKKTAFHPSYSSRVKAKNPPSRKTSIGKKEKQTILQSAKSIEDVSAVISDIEPDNRGIPTLLRHYLKLNAQLLSFNKDPDFSNVLDGLILVDLTQADPKMVKHFMGKENYAEFMEYHENE